MYRKIKRLMALVVSGLLMTSLPLTASAESPDELVARTRVLPIESNEIENWPQGPVVSAESAILMEAETGTILYAKDIHKQEYPASTTKILTTLIAAERCELNEEVYFSKRAVFSLPAGSNHIAMNAGDVLSMEQCLNAILIRSANEVAYAVAEHIGGSFEGFAEIMNERAKELGCVDSNFVNPNGLPDENHYTSAYDLAKIGQAFFDNSMLCDITLTKRLVVEKENGTLIDNNKMELIPGGKHAYPYIVGCKTGYTSAARYTLVSCAEKNGLKLICVVMRDENPFVYEDTISLFDYGFANFERVNVSETETKYNIDHVGLFYQSNSVFGSSGSLLALNDQDSIILPKTLTLSDLDSNIIYETGQANQAAVIEYSYRGHALGSVALEFQENTEKKSTFDDPEAASEEEKNPEKKPAFFFINVVKILMVLGGIAAAVLLFLFLRSIRDNFHFNFFDGGRRSLSRQRRQEIRQAKRRSRTRYKKRRWH